MSSVKIPRRIQRFPLEVAGSNKFGRYPKINAQKTFNMFVSDGWLVPTPGHEKVIEIRARQEGRGIFASVEGNFIIAVIDNEVWRISHEIEKLGRTIPIGGSGEEIATKVGEIETSTGDVFIDENNKQQIGICDKKDIYIYNYQSGDFQKAAIDWRPGYIAFQDTYFIAPDLDRNEWHLSDSNDGLAWGSGASSVGKFETKPDIPVACIRMPGKGNQLFVMGSTVTESWNDVGYKLFPYYRTNSFNIDYGCLNQATIAFGDKFIVWLGANEKSGPTILVSDGGPEQQISTDGINFELSQLSNPENAYGFMWKSDGHLFYQLTFVTDEKTYLYDFNENKFYFLTDETMHNHIAKKVIFFANDYYFISLIDGNIYRLDAKTTTYDGETIPRVRICNTVRLPDSSQFIGNALGFTMEQGINSNISRVDLSLSYDGGESFGNIVGKELNAVGHRQNKFNEYDLGYANELTLQLRFWGDGRFVCTDGYMEIYK